MGYGLISVKNDKPFLIEMNVLKMSSKTDGYVRLTMIHKKVDELIREHKPDELAIEAPFFGKNVQSMLKLGRAQGVAIATALHAGIPVSEYSPRKIKQSITGNGNAGKEQVWKMLQTLLQLGEEIKYFDASDALAVALCHHFQGSRLSKSSSGKLKSWDDFIAKNPHRVII
jgi:crossover junction endodeoxyribonuclease RuvC